MAKEKKKIKPVKVIVIIVVAAGVLTIAQLAVLGAMGGIGPMRFIRNNMMSKLPGNAEQYHPENLSVAEDSPLAGKRILFLGSSVTNGSAAMEVSVADYIRTLDNCEVVKEAQNGTTLVDKSGSSYLSRLKKLDKEQHFDAVIVQLSTNDATQKLPLGEVSDSKDSGQFDTSTIIGSMEAIIVYVVETWNCPVIFYTGTKYESTEYQSMVDMLPMLQEKWDIGVIDLWNNADMNAVSKEDYDFYMNDEIHPTQAGYLLWWTPVFQDYLYEWLD
ncbi:MAG: SGNH/GDSL hydrolase family protein [Clostridiales bacterium]|nr:SGNH/GDSL hydrolase family protein [Clostridiales bacterium]